MSKILDTIIGNIDDKKEWMALEKRAKALPRDYKIAYNEIKHYLWKSSGIISIDPFKNLLELFEDSAANGKLVLEITGDNVAAFCDELIRGEKTYFEDWRNQLNKDIVKKLKK